MRWMIWIGASLVLLLGLWVAASWYMVRGLEEAPYEVVSMADAYEVRTYPDIAIVNTRVDAVGNSANGTAFRRLAGYIFGGNASDRSIAMTAPVFIDNSGRETEMAFVLPKAISEASAPAPKSSDVTVTTQPGGRFAARRFSWFAGPERQKAEADKLLAALKADGLEPAGQPIYAAYNPPMTVPFMKRHEMLVRLAN